MGPAFEHRGPATDEAIAGLAAGLVDRVPGADRAPLAGVRRRAQAPAGPDSPATDLGRRFVPRRAQARRPLRRRVAPAVAGAERGAAGHAAPDARGVPRRGADRHRRHRRLLLRGHAAVRARDAQGNRGRTRRAGGRVPAARSPRPAWARCRCASRPGPPTSSATRSPPSAGRSLPWSASEPGSERARSHPPPARAGPGSGGGGRSGGGRHRHAGPRPNPASSNETRSFQHLLAPSATPLVAFRPRSLTRPRRPSRRFRHRPDAHVRRCRRRPGRRLRSGSGSGGRGPGPRDRRVPTTSWWNPMFLAGWWWSTAWPGPSWSVPADRPAVVVVELPAWPPEVVDVVGRMVVVVVAWRRRGGGGRGGGQRPDVGSRRVRSRCRWWSQVMAAEFGGYR